MSDKKKRILIACGSGIVTSTIARKKIEALLLDTHGYKGHYEIVQVPLSTASEKSKDCDFIVATAIKPSELHCPFVDGTPYLMGRGEDGANEQILKLMKK